jgi:hypothetical protein
MVDMRIAFDLHGVLEKYPEQFKKILSNVHGIGPEIGIISGPPTEQIISELQDLGFSPVVQYFDFVYSIVDFLSTVPVSVDSMGGEIYVKLWQDERGNWWCDDNSWWSSKGKICQLYKIDILVDDRIEYYSHMPTYFNTQFIHMTDCNFDEIVVKLLMLLKNCCPC